MKRNFTFTCMDRRMRETHRETGREPTCAGYALSSECFVLNRKEGTTANQPTNRVSKHINKISPSVGILKVKEKVLDK